MLQNRLYHQEMKTAHLKSYGTSHLSCFLQTSILSVHQLHKKFLHQPPYAVHYLIVQVNRCCVPNVYISVYSLRLWSLNLPQVRRASKILRGISSGVHKTNCWTSSLGSQEWPIEYMAHCISEGCTSNTKSAIMSNKSCLSVTTQIEVIKARLLLFERCFNRRFHFIRRRAQWKEGIHNLNDVQNLFTKRVPVIHFGKSPIRV